MIPGVDLPAIVDVVSEPTGVNMGCPKADPPQGNALFYDAVFDTALDDGLKTYDLNESIDEPKAASLKKGMAACNARIGSSCRSKSQACKGTSTRLH